jgi:adenylate cyclase
MSAAGKPEAPSPAKTATETSMDPAEPGRSRLFARLLRLRGPIAAIAAVGAMLGGFAGYWNVYRTVRDGVAPAKVAGNSLAVAGPLSIVVLPFVNLTGDADQASFADGLTATLTADLSRIPDAFVIDSASAQSYKGKALTAQQIGTALGVRFVLQGSVQRNGNHVRINAQLADATSNAQVWSDSFEGDTSDLFALQDQVTGRIANTMDHQMVVVAARESEKRRDNPKAADLLLRARALADRPQSLDNWQQVEHLYRQALEVDPGNVKAMMGLASALSFQATNFGSGLGAGVRERTWNEAMDLATRANASEPDNPEYYRVVAFHAGNHGDVEGQRRAAEAMLRLNPRSPAAYNVLAATFMRAGEPQRAIELLTKAVDLNRKNADAVFLNNLGRAYFMAGNNKAAIEWCDKALQTQPTFDLAHVVLAMAFALDGNEARARAEADEVRRLNPGFRFDLEKARARPESPAYRAYLEERAIPALRRAGLLE